MGLEHFDTVMSFAVVMLLLSMLITILVQVVVAVSGLRGWNLCVGVKQLLEQIDPDLKDHAKELAEAVLQHPSVAHTSTLRGRRKATAIRPDELLRILSDLTQPKSKILKAAAKKAVTDALVLAGVPDPPTVTARATVVVTELTKLFPAQAQAVQDAVNRGMVRTSQLESQVNAWFNTVMDRTTERFILHTRWITAFFAFTVAIGLQVDATQLFTQLSTNAEVRAKLIQGADATLKQAGVIVGDTQKQKPLASEAIRALATNNDLEDAGDSALVAKTPTDLVTREEGEDWLKKRFMEAKSEARLPKALIAYNTRFQEATLTYVKGLGTSFGQVETSLKATGLRLVFNNARGPDGTTSSGAFAFLGELMTGLFLSLGAPFWFNALRQLANLRPVIAGKVEKETRAS